jgi:hypothetical protein
VYQNATVLAEWGAEAQAMQDEALASTSRLIAADTKSHALSQFAPLFAFRFWLEKPAVTRRKVKSTRFSRFSRLLSDAQLMHLESGCNPSASESHRLIQNFEY